MGMPNLPRGPGGTDEETRRGIPPMARRQSKEQKETIERVMHEFKHGELRIRGSGPKVKNPNKAMPMPLNEAGASNQERPQKNRENLKRTKAKERRGETAQARAEGKKSARHRSRGGDSK